MAKREEVGYRRPPVATQFKPGQSGNPAGRPKRAPSFRAELLEELAELMPGAEGHSISKQRAVIRTLVHEAIGGNLRALGVLVGFLARGGAPEEKGEEQASDEDQQLLDDYLDRELKRRGIDHAAAAPVPPKDER
jgi:hypothetical protein